MKPRTPDRTIAQRQQSYRARMEANGFYPLQVFVPATAREMIIEIARDARDGHKILKRY